MRGSSIHAGGDRSRDFHGSSLLRGGWNHDFRTSNHGGLGSNCDGVRSNHDRRKSNFLRGGRNPSAGAMNLWSRESSPDFAARTLLEEGDDSNVSASAERTSRRKIRPFLAPPRGALEGQWPRFSQPSRHTSIVPALPQIASVPRERPAEGPSCRAMRSCRASRTFGTRGCRRWAWRFATSRIDVGDLSARALKDAPSPPRAPSRRASRHDSRCTGRGT